MVFSPLRLRLSGWFYHVLPARPGPGASNQAAEMPHVVAYRRGTGRAQPFGMAGPAVAAADEADDAHAGGDRGLHPGQAVLDDGAGSGAACMRCAANRNRSGAGLPRGTCDALKMWGSKYASSPVSRNECRSRSGALLEATQRGCGSVARTASMPGIARSSASNAVATRWRNLSAKFSGSPGRAPSWRDSRSASIAARLMPRYRSRILLG